MTMAKGAARQTAQFVSSHGDELGIVGFDSVAATDPRDAARDAGRRGETRARAHRGRDRGRRHEHLPRPRGGLDGILTSDVAQSPHDPAHRRHQPAARLHGSAGALKRHRIAVATVALGTDVDAALLRRSRRRPAETPTREARRAQLPKIFVKETRLSAEPIQIIGAAACAATGQPRSCAHWRARAAGGSRVTWSLACARTHRSTWSRAGQRDRTKPALAQWGYGTGRVVAVDAGPRRPLGTRWTGRPRSGTTPCAGPPAACRPARRQPRRGSGTSMTLEARPRSRRPTPAT